MSSSRQSSVLSEIEAWMDNLAPDDRAELERIAARDTASMILCPNPGPQTDAYYSEADELFFGGEAGGGKTDLLLGLAINGDHQLSQVYRLHVNDRSSLVMRMEELLKTKSGYNGTEHIWRVPVGIMPVVEFGALSDPTSWKKHQGRPGDLKAWDEVTQFPQEMFRTVNAWNRSTKKRADGTQQRSRVVAAGNPPWTADGLWVIEYWGPWLDPHHLNPARAGELRWFTTIDGHDVEVGQDWRGETHDGLEILPRSRTFIPSSLSDNPDLAESGYASNLASLPKHLREALAEGKFSASLQDDMLQIIPVDWVLAAQQRWNARKQEHDRRPTAMTDVGVDVALGGKDRMVIAPLHGTFFAEPIIKEGTEVKTPSQGAAAILASVRDDPRIKIDCGGGYGAGIVEHLVSNGMDAIPFIGAGASRELDRDRQRKFKNKRSEAIWRFREALDPERGDMIALPPGRQIIAELTCHREKRVDRMTIQVEDKGDIIKRLGRSPDIGEAIIMAWAEPDADQKRERRSRRKPGKGRDAARSPAILPGYGRAKEKYAPRNPPARKR